MEEKNIIYATSININSKISSNINLYLANTLTTEDYNKFIDFVEFFNITDLINPINFGKKNDKILCIDLENHNREISFFDLKIFLERNKINFSKIIDEYPELLYLIKR